MGFGENLKKFRHLSGLSQGKLSKEAGLSVSYISQAENGKYENPERETLEALGKVLNVHPHELLYGKAPIKITLQGNLPSNREMLSQEATLTDEERKILREWRELEERDRLFVKGMLKQLKKTEQIEDHAHDFKKKQHRVGNK